MNKKLFILPLLALCGQTMAQTDVTVNLKDKAVDSLRVIVSPSAFDRPVQNFTVAAKGGKAKFQVEETGLCKVFLHAVPGEKRTNFMLVPGAKTKVTGTWDELKLSGHVFYKDGEAYEATVKDTEAKFADVVSRAKALQEAGDEKGANAIYREELGSIREEMVGKTEAFIAAHPNSPYSVYLSTIYWRGEDRDKLMANISDEVKNGFMKDYVDAMDAREKKQQEEAERREKEREEQMAKMQGVDAPAFTLPAIDGTQLSIADLKGKVTVIDFWGKWCYWCMKGMPDMKKYYEKYAGKLEILGVNYGDTEEVWKKTVEESGLTWKHVRMDRTNKEQTAILQQYGVSGFPTKVILSAEGKILKVVVGEDPAFYTFLDELLGK